MDGKSLALATGMAAAVVLALGVFLLYMGGPPTSSPRPAPPLSAEAMANSDFKYSPTVYRALLEEDARKFKVPAPKLIDMSQPNPYFEEFKGRQKLGVGEKLDTPHLKLAVEVAKQTATVEGQTFAYEHLILRIENKTDKYLAYRVETWLLDARRCQQKGEIPHNNMVIEPRQTLLRTECLYRAYPSLDVTHVEVMELLPLEAYYVGRLPATTVLYDSRIAAAHVPLKGGLCPQTFSWREIKEGMDAKQFGWRDVLDFYARHNCEEYAFFKNYRYRTDPSEPLPVRPLD